MNFVTYLFADDAKMSKTIKNKNDLDNLQKGCNALESGLIYSL